MKNERFYVGRAKKVLDNDGILLSWEYEMNVDSVANAMITIDEGGGFADEHEVASDCAYNIVFVQKKEMDKDGYTHHIVFSPHFTKVEKKEVKSGTGKIRSLKDSDKGASAQAENEAEMAKQKRLEMEEDDVDLKDIPF